MKAFEHVEQQNRTLFVFGKYSNRHLLLLVDQKDRVKGKCRPWLKLLDVKHEEPSK